MKKESVSITRSQSAVTLNATGDSAEATTQSICADSTVNTISQDFEGEIDSLSNAFSLQRFDISDIDANDDGPFMVREYVKDITAYLFYLEVEK